MNFVPDIKLGKHFVGPTHSPFIIAEMSGNHNQSLDRALLMVETAAQSGAHALKLQTYTADTLTLDVNSSDFVISDPKSLWHGRSLYELYQEAYTPWEWHREIFARARSLGMECFSTPFDPTSVDFLEDLDCPFYKIASFENTDHQLLKYIAKTKKPIIMSTGTTYLDELTESVRILRDAGCVDLILLKCTSTYPADPLDSNLATIPHMRDLFGCQIGLSDHTLGIGVPVASVAFGATVIEKHFTMSRDEGGVDAAFSLEPHELKSLVQESERARRAIGKVSYEPQEKEIKSRMFKRSLYFVKDLPAGHIVTEEDFRSVRPAAGLPTKYSEVCVGRIIKTAVTYGTPVSLNLF
jgi:N-acetylneuraminate synthase